MMETAEEILNQIDGVSAAHGRFYLLQSQIFDAIGDSVQYYKSALKFLGCTKISDLNLTEQRNHAKHLAIAALVSEGIYNFGELVIIHRINAYLLMTVLLKRLINCFNNYYSWPIQF